ncbi:hypothetical protein Ae201684P_010240 [Aphanomyces euteiches]|uniref:Uncharacterized protein n=1 Tax=Aphanomyces euteiches TaxID=100861 RepID=A0A6G0X032_9STRA|nr:hypothetical protein Ae201684_009800 [Aphanomyces euteiches]KAH9096014.1 hypothetical protein Ae201684P_010218 [Aphanomyces euteiches]KAH9096036.1 hypothetical protein Ae201684P_010239 [Aphanomyces euteiches]KAH9096037.1 hypothetical protein Ae201684P_010240 [Aphanomyces euteiches]
MLSFLGLTSTASPAKPTSAPPQQTTQKQEQKNANPHSAQQHKTQVKPVTPQQQSTKQDQKHAKTQDNKQHQSKQQKNAKAVGPTKQTETPKQNQTSKAAPVQQPTKTKSMTPAQQLEMQQILNILIDEDWNDKTNKQPQPTPKQAQKTPKAPKPQDVKASKVSPKSTKSTTPVQQVPKTALTRKVSMTPAQLQEQKEIPHILIDEDWTPPAKKAQTNQKPTTRPGSAQTKQNTPAKTATTQSPPATQKKTQTHSKLSLSPAQQLEMQQILNILIDDAGKDWKPRNKTVKPHTKQPHQNPPTRPTSAKPRQTTQKATTPSPRPQTTSTPRPVPKMTLTPAQQVEMQQILNILIDDAGKDWKPRNKKPHDMTKIKKHGAKPTSFASKQKTPAQKTSPQSKPVAKKNTVSKVKAPTKSSVVKPDKPLHRRRSLTDAQKREKRAIMEILLEPYEYVPAPVRPRSSTVQLHAELDHKVGNVVVVSNQPVDASEDLSGFETVKSRHTTFQEKKEFRQEIGDMMSILIDWTEPLPKKQAKQTPKKATPQKTQTKTQTPTKPAAQAKTQPVSKPQTPSKPQDKTQNKTTKEATKPQTPKKAPKPQTTQQHKAPPATTHIQANKNQRAKLTT